MSGEQKKTARMDWRSWFKPKTLALAEQDEANGRLVNFEHNESDTWAAGDTAGGFHMEVFDAPNSYSTCIDIVPWNYHKRKRRKSSYSRYDFWGYDVEDEPDEYDGCRTVSHYCSCTIAQSGQLCRHLGSLMIRWEKIRGTFEFTETEEEEQQRLLREEALREQERKEREEARRRERERKKKEKLKKERFLALSYLKPMAPAIPDDITFPPDTPLKDVYTDRYETFLFEGYRKDKKETFSSLTVDYDSVGKQILKISGSADDNSVSMVMSEKEVSQLRCECGRSHDAYHYNWTEEGKHPFMCSHALAVYLAAWSKIVRDNPGDETDKKASVLLAALAGKTAEAPVISETDSKKPDISLEPRIIPDRSMRELQLAFSIGLRGGRSYKLRGLEKLYDAVEKEGVFELSKKAQIDFSKCTFTQDSVKWYDFIATRVRAIYNLNRKISERLYYYDRDYLRVGGAIPLEGSDLDVIYDLSEGSSLHYEKSKGEDLMVSVGKSRLQMEITLNPVYNKGNMLKAIDMQGLIPMTLEGNQYQYILDDRHFGRIDTEDIEELVPYRSAAKGGHSFTCTIGRRKFAEFFYRVLPEMQNSDYIKIIDHIGDKAEAFLPPEPDFFFYLDVKDGFITCRAYVQYGEDRYTLLVNALHDGRAGRDADQEERVEEAIRQYFPDVDLETKEAVTPDDEESLLRILTEGVALLSQFGQVNGSDAFYAVRVRKVQMPGLQISLESGILDLTIKTKDMTPDELLELLASYHLKKRWHRLKSGDFVDLREGDQLHELEDLASGIDIPLDVLIREGVRLPAYRALYIDKMLEAHEDIAASRDRHFKSLIRSYNTIRDSDFEVSGQLSDILRPYQVYGFRWLSTLAQSGFGGILADEMGLGKTIQMLALLKSAFDAGETRPSLVVCPASLVYNWGEECRRFTPELPVITLAGTLSQRKKMLADILTGKEATLLITSYDLLKRDITLYRDVAFASVVLDEAQYIKNPKAAVTKSVKTLNAAHRFALTGTPIENRLSELWSIFDFLMPGFLYTASEYSSMFETPIMKNRDRVAADKLSKMTEPFILRRKKVDVLKELPEKLEETKSSAMEGEQRKLYDAQVARMKVLLSSYTGTGDDKIRILAEITRLRQICCDPSLVFEDYRGPSTKREACMDLVKSAMDGGHRMLLFSQFTSMMALLEKDLKKEGIPYFVITGSTPKKERLRLVNEFNNGDIPVFLISLKAGGTGLNLTGADVVIHYDPWWNLAVQNQATDRAHRIGQTRQVTVMKLIAAESIEEKIVELQEAKKDLADAIIGNQTNSLMSLSKEELLELLSY